MPDAQERQREGRRIGKHAQRHALLGEVRALAERCLDAEHTYDRRAGPVWRDGAPPAVDAPTTVAAVDGQPHHV